MKKVMIVEDHQEIQILYKTIFRREPDLQIVAQEEDAESALEKIPQVKPDVIIVDITLPGMSGIDLTKEICQKFPDIRILVVTAHDPERYMHDAINAGADNLITKTSALEILREVKKLVECK